ncbi:MAG: enoyl-CoA hydratase/isomerase family protein, partial [Halobacteria archaeon]|nr:enoyl-CoA hydratase/isomerase family protein [Halobacteria archaeon]
MRVSDSGGVRTITFDRPDARNAFTGEVAKELADTIADTDIEKVDIVVLTGEGKAFSAGGDIKAMSQREESTHEAYERVRATLGRVFEEIWTAPFPVVAKVNGDAVGAGMSLAAVSDFAYASEGARFGSVFIKVGLIPDMGGSFLLPRIVGLRKAKELAFTGKLIAAEEAAEIGLVDRVLPSSELDKAVDEFVQELGSQPSE